MRGRVVFLFCAEVRSLGRRWACFWGGRAGREEAGLREGEAVRAQGDGVIVGDDALIGKVRQRARSKRRGKERTSRADSAAGRAKRWL